MNMSNTSQRFYGKFRGTITDNRDPSMLGRIRATVPSVLGCQDTGWAFPASPYAGKGVGFFFIPPIGANVWIEFEEGNTDYPIWTGCFWGQGEAPKMPAFPDFKMIKTDFVTITLNDQQGSGGLTIETKNGLKIAIGPKEIELSNGKASVKLTPKTVSINDGALEVT